MKDANKKIALFAYSWSETLEADAYINQIARAISGIGFDVDIYIANLFTKEYRNKGFLNNKTEAEIVKLILTKDYNCAISFNNALLTQKIVSALQGNVCSVLVDDLKHLFDHEQRSFSSIFDHKIKFICSSYNTIEKIQSIAPSIDERLIFLPTATNTKARENEYFGETYSISMILSRLDVSIYFSLLNAAVIERDAAYYELINLQVKLNEDPDICVEKLNNSEILRSFLARHGCLVEDLLISVQNVISNRKRIDVMQILSKHGLVYFGNKEWIQDFYSNPLLLMNYQFNRKVTSHAEIMNIYNSSKICVNSSQIQSGSAIQYRVIDVLASNALLIQEYHENSDLFKIFGHDVPIPMYRSLEELDYICAYYLTNEEERLQLVKKCNKLVGKGFSFEERASELVTIAGANLPAKILRQGKIKYIRNVRNNFSSLPDSSNSRILLRFIARTVKKFISTVSAL
jgi:hypothetical protein